jgi:hypothetical protein
MLTGTRIAGVTRAFAKNNNDFIELTSTIG